MSLVLAWAALAPPASAAAEVEVARWPVGEATPSLAELFDGIGEERFEPVPGQRPLLPPHRTEKQWFRIRAREHWTLSEAPVLALYAPHGNRVTVHLPPDYAPVARTVRDLDLDPQDSRHALVFPLPVHWGPAQPVYVQLDPGRRLPLRVAVEDRRVFEAGDIAYVRNLTAMLATLGVMWIVVGCFGFTLRERMYLMLFGALGCQLLYLLLLTGEAYSLDWLRWLSPWGFVPVWVSRALSSACLLAFAVAFLDLRRHAPRVARVLVACAWAFVVLAVVSPLSVLTPVQAVRSAISLTGNFLITLSDSLALATAFVLWRRGNRPAGFFLLAWTPVLALDVLREVQLATLAGIYPGNEYALPAAMATAAVLFSLGLADRLLTVRTEREAARLSAERDPLTRVLNRAAIGARLRVVCDHAWISKRPLAILLLDLDRIDSINTSHGHSIGDACLHAVVERAARELRHGDSLGRYGGEEFLMLLPGADHADAQAIAERIREAIEIGCRTVAGRSVDLTVSIGVAEFAGGTQQPEDLVAVADDAVYAAKRQGRNRVANAGAARRAA